MLAQLQDNKPFPPVEHALRNPNGLLAVGGDLSPRRLLDAYRHGIFPWFNADDPILWWSPDPRMVLFPQQFRISRSLRKTLSARNFEVRSDCAFEQVMRACAAPRPGQHGTWIHESMIAAYTALHRMGHAHSVEVWMPRTVSWSRVEAETRLQRKNDEEPATAGMSAENKRGCQHDIDGELELTGGIYGVAIGRMFYGESMFSRRTDASKIALAHLAAQLARWNFGMIDCQMYTPHLATLGAREIPRTEFVKRVRELIHYAERESPWKLEHDLIA
jgi:leucyl/phenylalanyl-tRNA--protein transferase